MIQQLRLQREAALDAAAMNAAMLSQANEEIGRLRQQIAAGESGKEPLPQGDRHA